MPPLESECKEDYNMVVSPNSVLSPNFDVDSLMREPSLNAEFLDNLLVQVSPSKVKRVLDEQVPIPHNDIRKPKQSVTGSPPLLPNFLPC